MQPDAVPTTAVPLLLDRVLNGLSLFTLAMTCRR